MICVDTNIICYRYMGSPRSQAADAAWAKDSAWIVPALWRSEFRNALAGSIRRRTLTADEAIQIWSIQCVVDAKGLVSHGELLLRFARNDLPVRLREQAIAISAISHH